MQNIEEYIIKGIRKAYSEDLQLHSVFDNFTHKIREYLLTVNVAQQLLEWNKQFEYKIYIEYPLKSFFDNAFVPCKFVGDSIFNQTILQRSIEHSGTKRLSQQIDLVITKEEINNSTFDRSIVGIELKGINKPKSLILNDINRLGKSMIGKDNISENSIELCYSAFLKRFDKDKDIITKDSIEQKLSKESQKWEKECAILRKIYPALSFCVNAFEIKSIPVDSIVQHFEENSDIAEVAYNTGSIYGYLIKIERKKEPAINN